MGVAISGVRQPLIERSVNDTGAIADNLVLQQKSITQDRTYLNLRGR